MKLSAIVDGTANRGEGAESFGQDSSTMAGAEDRVIREAECKRLSGLSRTTRWRLERSGKFPKRRQLSDNAVGWLWSEVLAWRGSRPTVVVGG